MLRKTKTITNQNQAEVLQIRRMKNRNRFSEKYWKKNHTHRLKEFFWFLCFRSTVFPQLCVLHFLVVILFYGIRLHTRLFVRQLSHLLGGFLTGWKTGYIQLSKTSGPAYHLGLVTNLLAGPMPVFTSLKHEPRFILHFLIFCQTAWHHTFSRFRVVPIKQTSSRFLKHFSMEYQAERYIETIEGGE